MFKFYWKLKKVKADLKAWAAVTFGHGSLLSTKIQEQLINAQNKMMEHPNCVVAAEDEARLFMEMNKALAMEASMKQQQLHDKWQVDGDRNSAFYHDSIKTKHARENILSIIDDDDNLQTTPKSVERAFIDHFKNILGNAVDFNPDLDLISSTTLSRITQMEAQSLISKVTNSEIKDTLFSMNTKSAGGPDGLNVHFFITNWDTVCNDFYKAIHNFFDHCKMLNEVNSTNIALVPKVPSPTSVQSFRPISCCNVVYKCISKIIASRLVKVLPSVVSTNQTAFIPNRSILDNVLIAQELLNGYGKSNISPSAAIKIDISKAYDSVHWPSIVRILACMRFPKIFVSWIYKCISTPTFSVLINGSPKGYFKSKKGIRQGDPLSSYLFILVMEVFTKMLEAKYISKHIKCHSKCKILGITSIIFADDVMIFCKPDLPSLASVVDTLNQFSLMSGLNMNATKSSLLLAGITNENAAAMYQLTGFGSMDNDMKYLGLPLITKRIMLADCIPLYNKISKPMDCWASRKLTQCGRLVLIETVIFSKLIYWARSIILPQKLIMMVRSAMIRFFWTGSIHNKKLLPCSFDNCEVPLRKGGLGVLNIKLWNIAAISKHFHDIITRRNSIWVRWIWNNKIGESYFWTMETKQGSSWIWRNILKLRERFLPLIQYHQNHLYDISFWFEPWMGRGIVLASVLDHLQMQQTGIQLKAKVSDFVHNGIVTLPPCSHQVVKQFWMKVHNKAHSNNQSHVTWKGKPHCVNKIYKSIAKFPTLPAAKWYKVVWNVKSPARENLMLWKTVSKALLTKDKLVSYGMPCCPLCVFCGAHFEDMEHLFFECNAISDLWNRHLYKFGMQNQNCSSVIMWELILKATRWKTSTAEALTVATKIYTDVIWKERNTILFESSRTSLNNLWEEIRRRTFMQLKRNSCDAMHHWIT